MVDKLLTTLSLLAGAFALAILAMPPALAADNPFSAPLATNARMAASEMKCAPGKCAVGKCVGAPAPKDGGMSSSDDAALKALCAEKIRGGFCGAGKCATGKCGDSLKDKCAKMIEGSGAMKCGGK